MLARGTEGVMIVIGPAKAEPVLTPLLDLRGTIAPLPISPFFCKNDVTGQVLPNQSNHAIQGGIQQPVTFLVTLTDDSHPCFPKLMRFKNALDLSGCCFGRPISAIAAPLNRFT